MTPAAAAVSGALDIEPIYYEPWKNDAACYDVRVVQGVIALLFDESSSFSAPAAFGTYRVLHQVGSGVLGPVFRTSDPRRPELVAVKAFKLDLRPDEVVRLADALRRLAALPPRHPALAAIVDAGLDGTTPFLATEYLIGDTLDVVLRRRAPLSLREALSLITPVAAALDSAWSAGVGHGALHPRDIFAGPDGIKITGIGIAQAIAAAGLSTPVRRPYAAPERAGKDWDQRADVYSLAVMAHELLTGRRPAGPTEQDGVFASDVPPEQRVAIRRVLAKALAERPDERFSSSAAFLEALEGVETATASRPATVSTLHEGPYLGAPPIEASAEVMPEGPAERLLADADEVIAETGPASENEADVFSPQGAAPEVRAGLLLDSPHAGNSRANQGPESDPLADLAYRPATGVGTPEDDLQPRDRAVPAWLAGTEPSPPSRTAPRWLGIVVGCLVVGGGVGYFAATYDPFGDFEQSRLADRGPADRVALPEAEPAAAPAPSVGPPVDAAPPPVAPPAPPPAPAASTRPAPVPALPAGGALDVRSEPSGAMVRLDGRLVGETPLVLRDLAAGPYLLQVARPGYAPHAERVMISAGGPERTVRVALEAGVTSPATMLGAIDVDSEPRGARVIVDGRFVGQSPLRVPEVRPGPHMVTLEMADRSSVTRRTVVEPGKTAKVIVNMQ